MITVVTLLSVEPAAKFKNIKQYNSNSKTEK